MSNNPTKPSLLDLPAEIRSQIYTLILKANWHVSFDRSEQFRVNLAIKIRKKRELKDQFGINLLRVCRCIYAEAAPIFYSINTFDVAGPVALTEFWQQIGSTNASCVKSLQWFDEQMELAQNDSVDGKPGLCYWTKSSESFHAWVPQFDHLATTFPSLMRFKVFLHNPSDDKVKLQFYEEAKVLMEIHPTMKKMITRHIDSRSILVKFVTESYWAATAPRSDTSERQEKKATHRSLEVQLDIVTEIAKYEEKIRSKAPG